MPAVETDGPGARASDDQASGAEALGSGAAGDSAPADGAPRRLSPLNALLRGGSWSALAQLAPLSTNLLLTPYIIHSLGADRYGLFVLVTSVTFFFGSFDAGLGPSAQRYFSIYAGADDRRATTKLLCSLLPVAVVVGGLLFVVVHFLGNELLGLFNIPHVLLSDGRFMLQVTSLTVLSTLTSGLFMAVVLARQRYALVSLLSISQYVVYAAGMVFVLHEGYGLRGMGWVFIAQATLLGGVAVPSASRYLTRSALGFASRPLMKEFLQYAWKVQTVGLSYLIIQQADALIIGVLLPVRQVGIYGPGASFALQLRNVPKNAINPLQTTLGISYGQSGSGPEFREEFLRLQRLWVLGSAGWCAAALGACAFGVSSWLGPNYRLSGVVAAVLMVGTLLNLSIAALLVYCQTVGKPGLEAKYALASLIINLSLTVPLALLFGIVGVVAATAVGEAASVFYLVRIVRRSEGPEVTGALRLIPVVPVLVSLAATVLLELAIRPIVPQGPVGLLMCAGPAAVGLVVYAVALLGPRRTVSSARVVVARLRARQA